jgi:hypothetical protein
VLFLGENVQDFEATFDQTQSFGFSQFDALAYVDKVLNDRVTHGIDFRLRPHPSEEPKQYQNAVTNLTRYIELSQSDLITDLTWCDMTVGLSSIALYYSSRAGASACSRVLSVGHRDRKSLNHLVRESGSGSRCPEKRVELRHWNQLMSNVAELK